MLNNNFWTSIDFKLNELGVICWNLCCLSAGPTQKVKENETQKAKRRLGGSLHIRHKLRY